MILTSGKTIKSVQRQYYLLSCRFLSFTGKKKEDVARSIFLLKPGFHQANYDHDCSDHVFNRIGSL